MIIPAFDGDLEEWTSKVKKILEDFLNAQEQKIADLEARVVELES